MILTMMYYRFSQKCEFVLEVRLKVQISIKLFMINPKSIHQTITLTPKHTG